MATTTNMPQLVDVEIDVNGDEVVVNDEEEGATTNGFEADGANNSSFSDSNSSSAASASPCSNKNNVSYTQFRRIVLLLLSDHGTNDVAGDTKKDNNDGATKKKKNRKAPPPPRTQQEPPLPISMFRLTTSKQTLAHARTVMSPCAPEEGAEKAKELLEKLQLEKTSVMNLARLLLSEMIVEKARELELQKTPGGARVSVIKDVGTCWANDGGLENADKVWTCLYGQFDLSPSWLEDMEAKVLQQHNWIYDSTTTKGEKNCGPKYTGCISKIITSVRRGLLRNVNNNGRDAHGKHFRISEKSREKRRRPGVFLPAVMVVDTNASSTADATVEVDDLSKEKLQKELTAARRVLDNQRRKLAAVAKVRIAGRLVVCDYSLYTNH